jgi:hypothetical protein
MDDDTREPDGEKGRPGWLAAHLHPPAAPPHLESRVARSLRGAGLLAPVQRRGASRPWRTASFSAIAAGLLGFWLGFGVAAPRNASAPRIGATTPRFVLLLYATPGANGRGGVEEHRQWAASIARSGHAITGEKLEPVAAPDPDAGAGAGTGALEGFFIVTARDEAEAATIARSAPHARHGGLVVVRRIAPT